MKNTQNMDESKLSGSVFGLHDSRIPVEEVCLLEKKNEGETKGKCVSDISEGESHCSDNGIHVGSKEEEEKQVKTFEDTSYVRLFGNYSE